MDPLAKIWTWTGQSFIPLAIGWIYFIRGGPESAMPSMGVLVSRGYWGLVLTLGAACVLIWTCSLYMRAAKAKGLGIWLPPNTTFEGEGSRSSFSTRTTATVFNVAIVGALIAFGERYGDSRIHTWDDPKPLWDDFITSRLYAHRLGCAHQPCFSVGQRLEAPGKALTGVNEYILYISDGTLIFLGILAIVALARMLLIAISSRPKARLQL